MVEERDKERDKQREVVEQKTQQRITELEEGNKQHEETEEKLRKTIADLQTQVQYLQRARDEEQRFNEGTKERELPRAECELETAETNLMVGAQEDFLNKLLSEEIRRRRGADKSSSHSSAETNPTTAPTSVAGSDVGDDTDALSKGKSSSMPFYTRLTKTGVPEGNHVAPPNPTRFSIKLPQPSEDIHFAPPRRPGSTTRYAVSKNTNPTTPRSPKKSFLSNADMQKVGTPRKRTQSLISSSGQSNALSPSKDTSLETSPSLFVSPTRVPNHPSPRKTRPSSQSTDEAVEMNSKLNRMTPRRNAPKTPPENEQRNKSKRRKTYTSPKFFDSPENSEPEDLRPVHLRPGSRWTEKDIGEVAKKKPDPKLQESGLHPNIIDQIHKTDTFRNPQHRYRSISKSIGTSSAICWLSQNDPLPKFKEMRPTRPGGETMCSQCKERKKRGLPGHCFYFIRSDRIVVYK